MSRRTKEGASIADWAANWLVAESVKRRRCTICSRTDRVYLDDEMTAHNLFHYSVRHWAHAHCLAQKHGTAAAMDMLRQPGLRREFRAAIRGCNDWERRMIAVKNRSLRSKRTRTEQR